MGGGRCDTGGVMYDPGKEVYFKIFISFHIFSESGPSVITDYQGALRLHYTYMSTTKK